MISKEDYAVIQALSKRGVYIKDIAAELDIHPKTVRRALSRGGAPVGQHKRRASKLDSYKEQIDQLLREGVWNAVVIFREIEAAGYDGRLTILRQYIAPRRALRRGRATVRFETPPGRQLQTDWGETKGVIAGELQTVYFEVDQLAYSRRFHFVRPHSALKKANQTQTPAMAAGLAAKVMTVGELLRTPMILPAT